MQFRAAAGHAHAGVIPSRAVKRKRRKFFFEYTPPLLSLLLLLKGSWPRRRQTSIVFAPSLPSFLLLFLLSFFVWLLPSIPVPSRRRTHFHFALVSILSVGNTARAPQMEATQFLQSAIDPH